MWSSRCATETDGCGAQRWENRLLWRDYYYTRDRLQIKRGGEPAGANERLLWHGTGRTAPATVLEHEHGGVLNLLTRHVYMHVHDHM